MMILICDSRETEGLANAFTLSNGRSMSDGNSNRADIAPTVAIAMT